MKPAYGQRSIGTQLVIRPTEGIGAATVERHNEILRQSLHRIEEQFTVEGIVFTPEDVIGEALMAKNCLLNVHGVSPYQAVTGRAPRILRDFEAPGTTECGEQEKTGASAPIGSSPNRMREIALQSILEGTSKDRINRALRSKSRMAGESLNLKNGDLVDFYRTPQNKDASGWIGPARVVDLTELDHGMISVKWQGYIYKCQVRHVRPALVFFTYAMEGEYAASAVHPIWQQVQARIHGSVAHMLYVSAAHM